MGERTEDFIAAAKEECISTILESDLLKGVAEEFTGLFASEAASEIIGSIIGALAPRVNGIVLTYKQNRFERNVRNMVCQLDKRINTLEANYLSLSEEMQKQITGVYVEMMLDNVVDERQEAKIPWNVNGFVNLMDEETNENIMQLFFDTLAELTTLDIDTLRLYHYNSDMDSYELTDKYGIGLDRLKVVKEKLVRLGLLSRKNDLQRDKNLDEISEYLIKAEKAANKPKPQSIKLPSAIKKISGVESYKITALGSGFLHSISDGD